MSSNTSESLSSRLSRLATTSGEMSSESIGARSETRTRASGRVPSLSSRTRCGSTKYAAAITIVKPAMAAHPIRRVRSRLAGPCDSGPAERLRSVRTAGRTSIAVRATARSSPAGAGVSVPVAGASRGGYSALRGDSKRRASQASSSDFRAKTVLPLPWLWRRTGRFSFSSQRRTVRTLRSRCDAISFHESSFSDDCGETRSPGSCGGSFN